MNEEEQYKKELEAAGVELPETKVEKEPEKEPEPTKDAPAAKEKPKDESKAEPDKEERAPLQEDPKAPPKPRSIYDDYKEKKLEAKTEKERANAAEKERDELKTKLEAVGKAETPEDKKEAQDDLEAFAQEIKADPAALRKMKELFLKDTKPATDPELLKRLESFETWQKTNSKVIEQAAFEEEFTKSQPKLTELFPKASPEEMLAIKKELDTISHTKDWHDKSLPYIAFEHKDTLSALISPKKRGMENSGRKHDAEDDSFEFDPNPDFSKMSDKQRDAWEAAYKEAGKTEGLSIGANGKKILL